MIAMLGARNVTVLEAGVVVSGLGLAALFPTAVAIFTEWFGTGGAGNIVLGMCGVGGALVPALMGTVALHSGSLRSGFIILLGCAALAAWIFRVMQSFIRLEKASALYDPAMQA
jgi:fucose permease